ncbi:hypothetical protein JYU34_004115 [Plutella xylostella]|uniref:TIL domain-containing protein n=1 Tax=Plutella xylostella TaxID=51655 RepID=A0ABQ7QX56_PLUXY|nr:hypothetical protein JYU34_004115 [Plutella xylostella]
MQLFLLFFTAYFALCANANAPVVDNSSCETYNDSDLSSSASSSEASSNSAEGSESNGSVTQESSQSSSASSFAAATASSQSSGSSDDGSYSYESSSSSAALSSSAASSSSSSTVTTGNQNNQNRCGINEVPDNCYNPCYEKNCANRLKPSRLCPLYCMTDGCSCREGFYRDDNRNCVPLQECTPPKCGTNEVYTNCGSACEINCTNIDNPPQACTLQCVEKCECLQGFIRNSDGNCVKKEECSSVQCGPNEESNGCYNSCLEKSCASRLNPPDVCPLYCEYGKCSCTDGYYRDDNGDCVQPFDCTPPRCGLNEVYTNCGSSCEVTCANVNNPPKVCTLQCVERCQCAEGFIRNSDGNCVRREECLPTIQCAENEEPTDCYNSCLEDSCANRLQPRRFCAQYCETNKCTCKRGFYRNDDGVCVPVEQCSQPKCFEGEEYTECGSACEATCNNLNDTSCTKQCVEKCSCRKGLVRSDDGSCILPENCSLQQQCKENEVYSDCKITHPPQTCDSIYSQYQPCEDCPCNPGCNCRDGYLRNGTMEDLCIPSESCPPPTPVCSDNEKFNSCGTACELTCDNYKNPPNVCTKECVAQCFCQEGLVRASDGSCILPEYCEIQKQCQENEVFSNCKITHPPQTCDSIYTQYQPCEDCPCDPGCNCKDGYLRNGTMNDVCIPSELCPTPQPSCPENQEFNSCGSACELTCDNYNNPPGFCTFQCVAKCFCKDGLVRASDGSCVLPQDCSLQPQCKENEVYSDCKIIRPPQTCDSIYTQYQPCEDCQCSPGCNCKDGYLRNGTMDDLCIPSESCPPPSPSCADKEQYKSCGTACELTCDNYKDAPLDCTKQCVEKCFCQDGLVRASDGTCVLPENCPPSQAAECPINEIFTNCTYNKCQKTCSDLEYHIACRPPPNCYEPGCVCKDDWVRDTNGKMYSS